MISENSKSSQISMNLRNCSKLVPKLQPDFPNLLGIAYYSKQFRKHYNIHCSSSGHILLFSSFQQQTHLQFVFVGSKDKLPCKSNASRFDRQQQTYKSCKSNVFTSMLFKSSIRPPFQDLDSPSRFLTLLFHSLS